MPDEVDQISNVIGDILAADARRASGMGSEAASSTSSSTVTHQVMARKGILPLYQYWKVPTVTDEDITTYHEGGWLFEALVCTPTTLDFPMIDRTSIVYFESHLMCGLGLPPIKFLVSVLNYIRCELIHLHSNTILVLSCFTMLCECSLGIPPDISLFWYYYSLTRYERKVFSGIGLTLRHNRREEYM
jgi:hypothetical protein